MSRPEESSPPAEGTWTETIRSAINSTSGAVHRAVNAAAGHSQEAEAKGTSTTTSTTTPAPAPTASFTPTPTSKDTTTFSSSKPAAPQPGQSASPTLTDKPSSTSNPRSDTSPSGLATGGLDSSRTKSKDPSLDLPPPQTSAPGSSTTRSDATDATEGSASEKPQINEGDPIGSTSDSKARLKGTQDSGPVSMSSQETSHPGAGAKPAAAAPVGDPPGKAPKGGKQGESNPLNEPTPKSKEDAEDLGTGQQYVKTSGVAAEGGDFDASKPGAGVPKIFHFVF